MKKRLQLAAVVTAAIGSLAGARSSAQSLDELNIQIHGYATQSFIYTNQNNWNTTDSSSGSAAWTEAVVNLSAQPEPRLRIGVQARYFLLGNVGNAITLDWAQADFKVNDRFGIRAGKVKTPVGLFNESQDIDPSQLWVLLPQSMYPIASRNSFLAHYGGVLYGSVPVGDRFGKVEYRAFAGQRVLASDDGYFQGLRDQGISVPNGLSGHTSGGALHWLPPLRGLIVGASENSGVSSGEVAAGPYPGTIAINQFRQTSYFSEYERDRLTLAAEYSRLQVAGAIQLTGLPPIVLQTDERPWYLMASYKLSGKLAVGAYYSVIANHHAAYVSSNYEKDRVVAARYDITPYLSAKFEQHWMQGTLVGFSVSDNPNLQPDTKMSLGKLGVSF